MPLFILTSLASEVLSWKSNLRPLSNLSLSQRFLEISTNNAHDSHDYDLYGTNHLLLQSGTAQEIDNNLPCFLFFYL
ncbi:hypothetical protein RclHR1_06060003 [Rhizophagus clarus]|nr:hypothetical protein RclHR1_06060003 [Rhizophagus clarus]